MPLLWVFPCWTPPSCFVEGGFASTSSVDLLLSTSFFLSCLSSSACRCGTGVLLEVLAGGSSSDLLLTNVFLCSFRSRGTPFAGLGGVLWRALTPSAVLRPCAWGRLALLACGDEVLCDRERLLSELKERLSLRDVLCLFSPRFPSFVLWCSVFASLPSSSFLLSFFSAEVAKR